MKISFSEMPKGKALLDFPDDTTFVLQDIEPRYLPDSFERILPNDSRYAQAISREEVLKRLK